MPRPTDGPPLVADLADEVASVTGVVPVVETLDGYEGGATVVTTTATFDGMDPVRTVVVCDTDDGRRAVAVSDDTGTAVRAVSEELIGTRVRMAGGAFDLG